MNDHLITGQVMSRLLRHACDNYALARRLQRERWIAGETTPAAMFAERAEHWLKQAQELGDWLHVRIVKHPNNPDRITTDLEVSLMRLARQVITNQA